MKSKLGHAKRIKNKVFVAWVLEGVRKSTFKNF